MKYEEQIVESKLYGAKAKIMKMNCVLCKIINCFIKQSILLQNSYKMKTNYAIKLVYIKLCQ